jgi:hypothetical protein
MSDPTPTNEQQDVHSRRFELHRDAAPMVPASGQNRSSFATVLAKREADPAWLTRTVEASRAYLDNLPASTRPAWYRARVNGDDAWWESLVQAECDAGHVIFVDDGDGTVYACPACALAEARAALAARPDPTAPLVDLSPATAPVVSDLLPAESIALTVALAQVQRGDDPSPNVAGMCVLALARLAGRHDWTVADAPAAEPERAPERLCADCGHVEGVHACTFAAIRCAMCGCTAFRPAADDEGGRE